MTAPGSRDIDIIATRILFESKDAIESLARFDKSIGKAAQRIQALTDITRKVASSLGNDFSKAEAAMKRIASIKMPTGELGKGGKPVMKPLIDPNELKQAFLIARGQSKEIGDFYRTIGIEQGKVTAAGSKTSAQLLAQQEKINAARQKENALIDQAGQKLSNQLKAQQRISDAQPGNKVQSFAAKQFGDLNSYIAQSQNKVAAWKSVVTQSARAAGVSFEQAGAQLRKMVSGTTVAPLNTALKQLGDDGRSAFQRLTEGAHFARIAIGALVSMILFQLLQAVQSVFSTAINNLQEFEATLYRISNVERELSLKGVEVSVQGLKKGVEEIKALLPIFSEEDISQMIGSLATATSHLGLSEQQIIKLGKAIAILNVQSVEEETLLQTQAKIVNAIVTSQAKGVGNLGITFSKNRIEAEALNLGLLEVGETMADLSDAEKTQAKLAIVLDKAGVEGAAAEFEALNGYLETSDAKSQELKAVWNDFLKEVAIQFAPLIIEFLQSSIDLVKGWSEALEENKETWTFISSVLAGIQKVQHNINSENADASGLEKTANKLLPFLGKIEDFKIKDIFKSFKEGFDEAQERAENFGAYVETATGDVEIEIDVEGEQESIEAFEKLEDAIEEVSIDAQHAREDLALALQQKTEDIEIGFAQKNADTELEALQKSEDAVVDYNNRVADINLDAQQKIEDAKRKAREDELNAERELILKLKELRQRFLLDLEEALHERDARQVLRLIKEYQFDKQSILDRKKLEDQERAAKLAADLRNIEIERQQRLQSAAIELQRKLADIQIEKQRELEENALWRERELSELATWHARELEEIDRQSQQKLEKLIANYAQEYGLHQREQEKIHQLLLQYFNANVGLISGLMGYMASLALQMQSLSFSAAAFPQYFQSEKGFAPGGTNPSYAGAFAEGGAIVANRPTVAMFGEAGKELATFTPLNKGAPKNPFGSLEGAGGANGKVMIEMLLSPDLEARITENTLNKTADIVTRVARSK